LLALALGCGSLPAADLQDLFANRETVSNLAGSASGNNLGATVEAGEPRHGARIGGASVWISWVAPTNSIVTFSTAGSTFDTVIAAYYVEDGDPAIFDKLHRAAENDDEKGTASVIVFGARAGKRYEIAIDSYQGDRGAIELSWSAEVVGEAPPVILSVPDDQALQEGMPLTLSVALENPSAYNLHWYLNGQELLDEESETLFIPALDSSHVGRYRLRLSLGEFRYFSKSVEIQINSEGLSDSLVRDKFFDTLAPGSAGTTINAVAKPGVGSKQPGFHILDAVNRGYNGSQIYNTIQATAAPDEPPICGVTGAVTWLAYQPPASGTFILNSDGSEIAVAMTLFTFTPPLTDINQLVEITCDSPPPNGMVSELECAVLTGETYVVGIAGLDGARGIVRLNYSLDQTRPPLPPEVFFGGAELTVAAGRPLVLAATATGSPPLHYSWLKNGSPVSPVDSYSLVIPSTTPGDAGAYSVRVRNHIAEALGGTLSVRVLVPPNLHLDRASGRYILTVETQPLQNYQVEYRDPSGGTFWIPLGAPFPGTGAAVRLTNDPPSSSDAWFRVRVQ